MPTHTSPERNSGTEKLAHARGGKAVYLMNSCTTSGVHDVTAHEKFYGKKPDLFHIRIFGSIAFVHIPDEKRQKLDPKSKKCILVGYSLEQSPSPSPPMAGFTYVAFLHLHLPLHILLCLASPILTQISCHEFLFTGD